MKDIEHSLQRILSLLNLAEELGNISQACRAAGYSRESFYRYRDLYAYGGEDALRDTLRRTGGRPRKLTDEEINELRRGLHAVIEVV
jgi:molybdenum-dependent DNA-binding transcriptional regulator ModE